MSIGEVHIISLGLTFIDAEGIKENMSYAKINKGFTKLENEYQEDGEEMEKHSQRPRRRDQACPSVSKRYCLDIA